MLISIKFFIFYFLLVWLVKVYKILKYLSLIIRNISYVLYVFDDVLKHDFIISGHRLVSGIFDLIAVAAGARSPRVLRVYAMYTGWSLGQNVSFDPVTIVASRKNILKMMCPRIVDPARTFVLALYGPLSLYRYWYSVLGTNRAAVRRPHCVNNPRERTRSCELW